MPAYTRFQKWPAILLGLSLGCTLNVVTADDTEIFYGQSKDAFENNPNVLFVLDSSGSMGRDDDTPSTRMERLKEAMRLLLDQSSSFNVGLMAFQGWNWGGAVRYPVGYLEGDSTDLCDGGVCPDELVVARPGSANDDATEHDSSLEVSLNAQSLVMANLPSSGPTTPTGVTVNGSSAAIADVSEARQTVTNEYAYKHNESVGDWFYQGVADYDSPIFAYRFENIDIPPDATVTEAHITFTRTNLSDQVGNVSAVITTEAKGAPVALDSAGITALPIYQRQDITNRSKALVRWDNISPYTDTDGNSLDDPTSDKVDSPDISELLTEVAGLTTWLQGNAVTVMLKAADGYTPSDLDLRRFYGSTALSTQVPILSYTYTKAADPDISSLTVDAADHVDEITEQSTMVFSQNHGNKVSRLFYAGDEYAPRKLGLRFDTIGIPKNAVIKSAFLTLSSAATTSNEDADDKWVRDPTAPPLDGTTTAGTTGGSTAGGTDGGTDGTTTGGGTTGDGTGTADDGTVDPIVSINIKAELSEDPDAYTDTALDARTYTSNFISWNDVADNPDTEFVSPDLSGLITEITSLSDWQEDDDLSLVLSAPDDYDNLADNVRRFFTSKGGFKPRLEITWEDTTTIDTGTVDTQTTAIRFNRVHIPPSALIKTAELVFHSATANDEQTVLDISGELTPSSKAFVASNNNIGSRQRTTARKVWDVPAWTSPNTEYRSDDITPIVQEIINQSDWCGGNPLSIFLKANQGEGFRDAVSFDENSIRAPSLHITYEPGSVSAESYCSNTSVVVSLVDGADDAVENLSTNTIDIAASRMSTNSEDDGSGDAQAIGLRFRGVQVPANAAIVSAVIQLTSAVDITEAANLSIAPELSVNPNPYYPADKISTRNYGPASTWASQAPVAAGEGAFSIDIADMVTNSVNQTGWAAGNAMAFKIAGQAATTAREFLSIESGEAEAATLIIYYESQRSAPGSRFRDKLIQQVDELVAEGATPIVSSMYEAAQYFHGDSVDYGLRRGSQAYFDRYHRVSHPNSYTSGTVSRPIGCNDSNLDSQNCTNETINGGTGTAAKYTSPITSQCQSNHIVILTDGRATSNSAVGRIEGKTGVSCETRSNGSEQCGFELASWLNSADAVSDIPGDQTISTHTIAFNLSDDTATQDFLAGIASNGGGESYQADSAADLVSAFRNIFNAVSKVDATFVAPSATISQSNRLKNRDDIYFSLFKPEATARWSGNLKRYRVQADAGETASIVDVNDKVAVDPTTGQFIADTRSWWSTLDDGGSVPVGGAAEQLNRPSQSHLNRGVYTFAGTNQNITHEDNALLPDNPNILQEWFDLSAAHTSDADYYNNLVNWAHGADHFDVDGDGDQGEVRQQLGDPMHSQPVLLNYVGDESVVYVATNEGFLHAFDTDDGKEKYAFIPTELLKNLRRFFDNTPTRQRPYGLDGGITTWVDDTDHDGIIDASKGDKAYMYIGMRRGGDLYYALDVSSPDSPKFLWKIKGGTNTVDTDLTTADGDYEELGQTWSKPVKSSVLIGGTERDVLFFAAGYDPNQDPAVSSSTGSDTTDTTDTTDTSGTTTVTRPQDGIGRGIFISDAKTGELLWTTSLADPDFEDMNYSIPSDVKVLDVNLDGMADQVYVGDMGGQIWRFDIDNDAANTATFSSRVDGGVIAKLSGSEPDNWRRFYYPPDVALISVRGQQQLAINIGSGWRAHPLDTDVKDRFYSLRSRYVYGPPIDSNGSIDYPTITESGNTSTFKNVTNSLSASYEDVKDGWFFDLTESGEKVLSSSVTATGNVIFTTYLPTTDANACAAAVGSSAVYTVDVYNGDPVPPVGGTPSGTTPSHASRKQALAIEGIPPAISVLFPETGEATVMVGTNKLDDIDIGPLRRRTFWQEMLDPES